MKGRLCAVFFVALSIVYSAGAVDGIAVGVSSGNTNGFGHHTGQILKSVISNNAVTEQKIIYTGNDARCISISPKGDRVAFIRNGKVCVMSMDGGEVKELASMPNDAWLDWPMEEWVYYTSGWKGNDLMKVNTSGTPEAQLAATGLESAMRGRGGLRATGLPMWARGADAAREFRRMDNTCRTIRVIMRRLLSANSTAAMSARSTRANRTPAPTGTVTGGRRTPTTG
jgi:hypothetical protein